jgi:hypothetical protein
MSVNSSVNTDPYVAENIDVLRWFQTIPNSRARFLFLGGLKITEMHCSFA